MRVRRLVGVVSLLAVFLPGPVRAGFQDTDLILPAIGRVAGAGGSQFYATVWVTNPSAVDTVGFQMQFLATGQSNLTPATVSQTLAPHETRAYENIAEKLFGLRGVSGALRVRSSQPLIASSRIYNQFDGMPEAASQGAFFGGTPARFGLASGESGILQGLRVTSDYRYNLLFVETTGNAVSVSMKILSAAGAEVVATNVELAAYEQRLLSLGSLAPGLTLTDGSAIATVTSGAGRVTVAGSLIANDSQDSSGFEIALASAFDGVTSLNGLKGDLTLKAGSNIAIDKTDTNVFTINATIAAGARGPAGAPGLPGSPGAAGVAGATGPVGMTWRGTWDPAATYVDRDAVQFGGAAYISLANPNMGNNPSTTPASWSLLAQAATGGPAGGDLTGTYPNPTIGAATISTAKLQPGAVTTAILGVSSVDSSKIIDASISSADLGPASVTLPKIDTTGAAAGQALIFNGGAIAWSAPLLSLPYAQTVSTASTAFAITNTGTGATTFFIHNNPGSSSQTVAATGNGTGATLFTQSSGTGSALLATASGTGTAASISNANAASTAPAASISANGSGISLIVSANGAAGSAASISNNNAANVQTALDVSTQGTGTAGTFRILNAASGGTAINATTSGFGHAITATSASNSAVLGTSTSGAGVIGVGTTFIGVGGTSTTGMGVSGTSTSGVGVSANSFSGTAVNATSTSGIGVSGSSLSGIAGVFSVPAPNSSPAISALTLGTGNAITANATTGSALSALSGGAAVSAVSTNSSAVTARATAADTLDVFMDAAGHYAAHFSGTAANANGVQITSGVNGQAINVTRGSLVGSIASVLSGSVAPSDFMIVEVSDNGVAASPATVTLPAAPPVGTMMFVGSGDFDGLLVNGATLQPPSRMRMWIFTSIGWMTAG